MKLFFLGNNILGLEVLKWLRSRNEEIVGLAIHTKEKERYVPKVIEASGVPAGAIFEGPSLHQTATLEYIRNLGADIAVSAGFGYILRPSFFNLFPKEVINLHTGYLPFNRGAYPNVWSLIESTPAGATLHYIDEGVDTGDMIAQERVEITWLDTGATLQRKLNAAALDLFKKTWPQICDGKAIRRKQDKAQGNFHMVRDTESIDQIDLDKEYRVRDLINILRARTYPPFRGAYFYDGNEKIYIRVTLHREEDF